MLYLWLKALHVLTVTVWLGAACSMLAILGLLLRETDRPRMAALAAAADFIGLRLIAPSGGIAFLLGIVAMGVGRVHMVLWIWWGIIAGLLVLSIGGAVLGRGFRKVAYELQDPAADLAGVTRQVRRFQRIGGAVILVLISAVVVMVLKPI